MAKTAVIRARIEPELKIDAEYILQELGLTPTEAVTLFYRQIKMTRSLPFPIKLPNDVTVKTFQKTDAGENVIHAQTKEDLFELLDM